MARHPVTLYLSDTELDALRVEAISQDRSLNWTIRRKLFAAPFPKQSAISRADITDQGSLKQEELSASHAHQNQIHASRESLIPSDRGPLKPLWKDSEWDAIVEQFGANSPQAHTYQSEHRSP